MATAAQTHTLTFPGAILARGFWLYVWKIVTAEGKTVLYVGRTGDTSSPNAQSPFNRLSQHLGRNRHANALRRNLENAGIEPEKCRSFNMIAHGPLLVEQADMESHKPCRDTMAALEKALADALATAGYTVLNKVGCKIPVDSERLRAVLDSFTPHFPKLKEEICRP